MRARGLALAAALLLAGAANAGAPAGAPAGEPGSRKEEWERWKSVFGSGRLLATGGVTQVEGAAGGGLVPWAVLAGYGTEDQVGGAGWYTRVGSNDILLQAYGASLSFLQRLEVSVAHQRVDVEDPVDDEISQFIAGAKVRLLGDLVYTPWPTVAAGVQYKRNLDYETPDAVGSKSQDGVDVYLAASKLFLNGVYGFPVLLNTTVRATRANEMGLLGFGGPGHNTYQAMFEGSAVILATRHIALGAEYRMKPHNLAGLDEDDWVDAFVAVFVNKHLSLVGGYVRLGDVAVFNNQDSYYLHLQAGF